MLEKIIDFELKYKLIGESIHKYNETFWVIFKQCSATLDEH